MIERVDDEPLFLRRTPGIALLAVGLIVIAYAANGMVDVVRPRLEGIPRLEPTVPVLAAAIGGPLLVIAALVVIRRMGASRRRQVAEYASRDGDFGAEHARLFSVRPMVWALSALVWLVLGAFAVVLLNWAAGSPVSAIAGASTVILVGGAAVLVPLALFLYLFFQGADQGEQRLATERYRRGIGSSR